MHSACVIIQGSPGFGSGRDFFLPAAPFTPMFGVESRRPDLVRLVRHGPGCAGGWVPSIEQMDETCRGSARKEVAPCRALSLCHPHRPIVGEEGGPRSMEE